MRQHVNPLSNHYDQIVPIPQLEEIYKDPNLPLHLDLGSASGDFLLNLAVQNQNWNYMGIEIREKLVINAKLKAKYNKLENLFFAHGNANNLIKDVLNKLNKINFHSISVFFPDPWFKKKHHKRRIIQDEFINNLNLLMPKGSTIFVKSDVFELFQNIDLTILNSSNFIEIDNYIDLKKSFNPSGLKTEREDYVNNNKLPIFERVYLKKQIF